MKSLSEVWSWVKGNKKPPHLIKVKSFHELINPKNQTIINSIYRNSHTSEVNWQQTYLPTIKNLVLFIQSLPASENHHHAYNGGFVDHTLEVVDIAIKKRNTMMLPRGRSVETQNKIKDDWTFAIFVAAIMHDIGKINSDIMINLYDKHYQLLGRYNPYFGNMYAIGAKFYDYKYIPHDYKDHLLVGATMLMHIVPIVSLDHLKKNNKLFSLMLLSINGRYAEASDIGDIVKESDSSSTARSFANTNQSHTDTNSAKPSLADRLLIAIRYVVLEKKQSKKINEPGSIAFTTEEFIYLFSKRILDEARDELTKNNQGGVPYDNSRLMDELLDFNIIDKNPDDKAIFDVEVSGGGFKNKGSFTFLRMSIHKIYPNQSKRPTPFTGRIKEIIKKEKEDNAQTATVEEINLPLPPGIMSKEDNAQTATVKEINLSLPPGIMLKEKKQPKSNNTKEKTEKIENNSDSHVKAQIKQTNFEELTAKECGYLFIDWLVDGLKNGKIATNNKNSSIHILPEGLFLVSPSIFQSFNQDHWHKIQKGLTQIKLAKKTPSNTNIWKISVKPEYHHNKNKPTNKISGYLINNYDKQLNIPQMPINQKISLIK